MKNLLWIPILLVSAPFSLLAQSEGIAEMKMTFASGDAKGKGSGKMTFYVSKTGSRNDMEFSGGELKQAGMAAFKMTMIQKTAQPDLVYSLNETMKTYTVMDLKEIREQSKGTKSDTTFTVKKLGKDAVAGYACEKALLTSSKGDETEVCVTKELFGSADWFERLNRSEVQRNGMFRTLKENGLDGMPVRMVFKGKDKGEAAAVMELVSFKKQSVPASVFEIPAGYRKTDMMGMFMTPEAQQKMKEMMQKMTPEQRKQLEDAMKKPKGQ